MAFDSGMRINLVEREVEAFPPPGAVLLRVCWPGSGPFMLTITETPRACGAEARPIAPASGAPITAVARKGAPHCPDAAIQVPLHPMNARPRVDFLRTLASVRIY
jgi:hypothetical protein